MKPEKMMMNESEGENFDGPYSHWDYLIPQKRCISVRRDLRIPFFPGKFARSEECSECDTECCFEVGGAKACIEGEQFDNKDEEVSSDSRISRDTRGMVHEIHWFGDPAARVGFSVHFRKGWGPIAVSQH